MGDTNFNNTETEKDAADLKADAGSDTLNGAPSSAQNDKNRIEKSRKEVLEIIDKNKKSSLVQGDGAKEVVPKGKISSWIKRVFDGSDEAGSVKEEKAKAVTAAPAVKEEIKASEPKKDSPMVFSNNAWSSAGVLETNLIDKSDYAFFDTDKKIRSLLAGILASSFLVLTFYLGILYWEHLQLDSLREQKTKIKTLEEEVRKLETETEEARNFQGKLSVAIEILNRHVYWSNFFNFLENKTLPNVFYAKGVSMGVDKPFSLQARTGSYESMKDQLKVLSSDDRISELNLSGVNTYSESAVPDSSGASSTVPVVPTTKSGVEFSIGFKLDDGIFYKNEAAEATGTAATADSLGQKQ